MAHSDCIVAIMQHDCLLHVFIQRLMSGDLGYGGATYDFFQEVLHLFDPPAMLQVAVNALLLVFKVDQYALESWGKAEQSHPLTQLLRRNWSLVGLATHEHRPLEGHSGAKNAQFAMHPFYPTKRSVHHTTPRAWSSR